ncbi:hypothetical protein [Winogradskyella sp. 3972H.M.0a.05]|uniref:LA_2272 family surface repeat-containing protein n=1 Tax=Winogradskyella sp. 3972H.M.0a.05 TaxID=2950277 RepID=UPI00339B2D7A
MKNYLLLILMLLVQIPVVGQDVKDTIYVNKVNFKDVKFTQNTTIIERNVFAFSPSKANKINGLNLNYWYDESSATMTNGIELGLNPLGVFFPFLTVIHSIPPFIHDPNTYKQSYVDDMVFDKVNGIRVGISFLEPAIINGIELNLTGGFDTKVNGLSMSPIIHKHMMVNGVGIALLGNFDTQVNGIQIGLFNKCSNLRGLQFGLWNKNSKRSLPFVNWNFK